MTQEVEKHPGPFIGPDCELARACAVTVMPWYGDLEGDQMQRFLVNPWNDHVAVQSALAMIAHIRKHGLPNND